MISRYEVTLNGNKLSEINENLLILNVEYVKPEYRDAVFSPAKREGEIVTERIKARARVNVSFELHVYDIAERQAVYQQVVAWCKNGGVLEINDRPGMRLIAVCEDYPTIDSVRDWTNPLSLTFASRSFPYWEDSEETVATLSGANARGAIVVPGAIGNAFATVTVTALNNISQLTVSIGGNTIQLTGLSVARNSIVVFGYDDDGFLYIKNGNTSLLNKRTGASDDDLFAVCGQSNPISVIASAPVTARFSVRGCWQ